LDSVVAIIIIIIINIIILIISLAVSQSYLAMFFVVTLDISITFL